MYICIVLICTTGGFQFIVFLHRFSAFPKTELNFSQPAQHLVIWAQTSGSFMFISSNSLSFGHKSS